ncbi:MAG: glycosyl hydrolase-related protein [Fimbriimonadales bacterium]
MDTARIPLYYTFGNHMHWVDMEWLWGYEVLPGSAQDMIGLCERTGAKGNLNFDAVGYERMAAEAPDAFAKLRQAVRSGQIEVVGASYAQPYGLFHGAESNIRQRVYGVRTVMRLFGVRPRTFWEEEFDFFPQLPQILRGVGYQYACLFFQWTWHTPELPRETAPAIWWVGMDGSQLLTAPRGPLNLHQWPEDFEGLLESDLIPQLQEPCIIQWLELMPSPDWMCRAELIEPPLRQLMSHPRYEIRFVTLSEYLEQVRPHAQPRAYTLGEVFHGLSLGKNGDRMRRMSRIAEQTLLSAETLSAMMGLFGRPYAHWDVYPAWELDEAWRELMIAQHHDNDECEGLCGFIGMQGYHRSTALSTQILKRTLNLLAQRIKTEHRTPLLFNPLGWARTGIFVDPEQKRLLRVPNIPPMGYLAPTPDELEAVPATLLDEDATAFHLRRNSIHVVVDKATGFIRQIYSEQFPEGMLTPDTPLGQLYMRRGGKPVNFEVQVAVQDTPPYPTLEMTYAMEGQEALTLTLSLAPEYDGVDLEYHSERLPRPDGGFQGALKTPITFAMSHHRLLHDHPYGVSPITPNGTYLRKYPTGDWMTSPQVFEEVQNPFTALNLLDFDGGERGVLYLHDGNQSMQWDGSRVWHILNLYDPWDEDYFVGQLRCKVRIVPHGTLSHAQRWRMAQEFTRPVLVRSCEPSDGDLPPKFALVWCDAPHCVVSACYREAEAYARIGLDDYAGSGVGFPYILRLVELEGKAGTAGLNIAGTVEKCYKTNLLGEPMEALPVKPTEPPIPMGAPYSRVEVALRPYEIATLYLDIVEGRKQARNLDAYRSVWATVHKV